MEENDYKDKDKNPDIAVVKKVAKAIHNKSSVKYITRYLNVILNVVPQGKLTFFSPNTILCCHLKYVLKT